MTEHHLQAVIVLFCALIIFCMTMHTYYLETKRLPRSSLLVLSWICFFISLCVPVTSSYDIDYGNFTGTYGIEVLIIVILVGLRSLFSHWQLNPVIVFSIMNLFFLFSPLLFIIRNRRDSNPSKIACALIPLGFIAAWASILEIQQFSLGYVFWSTAITLAGIDYLKPGREKSFDSNQKTVPTEQSYENTEPSF